MKWVGPVIIAVAYILLVGFIIIWIGNETSNFAEFSQYWGLFGLIVGVTTGAIPAFFFKASADQAKADAAKAGQRAEVYAMYMPGEKAAEARAEIAAL